MASNFRAIILSTLAAALLSGTAGSALAQVQYDRNVRAADIVVTPFSPDPLLSDSGYRIAVRALGLNRTGSEINLSSDVVVTVNNIPVGAFNRISWVWPGGSSICSSSGGACSGFDCAPGNFCTNTVAGGCGCHAIFDMTVPGPVALYNGDVVGILIAASPGALPEVATSDDAASIVFHTGTPCRADFNHSGALSVQDIFDFLAAYFSGNPAADINHSNTLTVQDLFDFLAAYFAGCP